MQQDITSKSQVKQRTSKFMPLPIYYTFTIQLYKTQSFQGLAQITFHLQSTQDIYIDCNFTKLQRLRINDDQVNGTIDDEQVYLPRKYLRVGKNVVLIKYRNKVLNKSEGLIQNMDKTGQPVWVTQFEPMFAPQVFPVFDQPDLKGQMRLVVVCPEKLHVLSNEKEVYVSNKMVKADIKGHVPSRFNEEICDFVEGHQKGRIWIFPETEVLPSYLFCFAVGNFRQIVCPEKTTVPLTLYATADHYPLLEKQADLIFKVTIQGIKFFQSYFQTAYPFKKYDQLFTIGCPTAMQNAGISIFKYTYLEVQQNNHDEYVRLCRIILHQLCHHWFGNLCTMEYWDDIWLNEGITTFMQDYALRNILPKLSVFKQGIEPNILYKKNVAFNLQKDDGKRNHPLRLKQLCYCHLFDDITYNKGAVITQEFHNLIGDKNFSDFCRDVMEKFRWKNWNTEDFYHLGKNYCPKDIDFKEWVEMFVETQGVTTLKSDIDYDKGCLVVSQVKGDLRQYRTTIALFQQDCSSKIIHHTIRSKHQRIPIQHLQKYKAVLMNPTNNNYYLQTFSQQSLKFFKQNYERIPQHHLRLMIYYSIDRNQRFSYSSEEFVIKLLNREETQSGIGRILSQMYSFILKEEVSKGKLRLVRRIIERIGEIRKGEKDAVKIGSYENYRSSFEEMEEGIKEKLE